MLSKQIELTGGLRGKDHLKVQMGEESKPEGKIFIEIKPHGEADLAPAAVPDAFALHGAEFFVLIVHQIGALDLFLPQRPGATVTRDEFPPTIKRIDGEGAVVGAQTAGDGLGCVGKLLKRGGAEQSGGIQLGVTGGESRAERTHQSGDGGSGHIAAQLLFKRAEHSIVQEGAALDHDVLAQVISGDGANDLVNGIFYDGNRETCRDILYTGPVLLRLLDTGVHKHGAAGTQIDRMLGQQAQLREISDVVAQSFGKGFNEGAAAGGTSLVEHDGVHRAAADLEALHVLTADIDDEVHIGVEVGGGVVVGYRFHQAQVAVEGVLDQVLAVAGHRRALDLNTVAAELVDLLKLLQDNGYGVAQIGMVIGIEHPAVGSNEHHFSGRGAGVNA